MHCRHIIHCRAELQGFKTVLLYDPSGTVKDYTSELADEPQLVAVPSPPLAFHVGWGDSISHSPHLDVFVLGAEDGEQPLDVAGGMGRDESPPETGDLMGDLLAHALAAPQRLRARIAAATGSSSVALEPDLLVVFGPCLTLAGFPAWATRASEIYYGGPLSQASGSKLASILRRHARTRQRHGR